MIVKTIDITQGVEYITDTGEIFRKYDSGNWLYLRGGYWEVVDDEGKRGELEAMKAEEAPSLRQPEAD